MNERLAPYTKIRGSFVGRLGFLGYDRDRGRPVAVTARQLLKSRLLLRSSLEYLGNATVIDLERRDDFYGIDISELLVLAELRGDILFEKSSSSEDIPFNLEVRGLHHETEDLLGERLWLKLGANDYREVFVETVAGRFLMPHPKSGEVELFTGAIGVASADKQKLTVHGDAGTLAVTEDGDAVGVVVCGRDDIAFIAPLAPFLKNFGDIVTLTSEHVEAFEKPRRTSTPESTGKAVLSKKALQNKLQKMNEALQLSDDEALQAVATEIEDEVLS